MKKYLSLCILFFLTLLLSSCISRNDPFRVVVSGDFIYSKVGVSKPDKNVAIIRLSEVGLTKETIVFPTEIDGYHVSKVGTQLVKRPSGPIVFTNAKSIYIPKIYLKTHFEFNYSNNSTLNIFIGSRFADSNVFPLTEEIEPTKVFVKKEYYDDKVRLGQMDRHNFIPANISYYLSDNPSESFFIDDADGTVVNVIPPNPYKEGHEFVGWYKDLEGIEVWDFINDTVPKKVYDEEGNYIFEETKIYAIWK